MASRSIWRPTLVILAVAAGVAGLNFYRSWRQISNERAVAVEHTRLDAERRLAEKWLADAQLEQSQLRIDLRAKQNARPTQRPSGRPQPAPQSAEQIAAQAKAETARRALKYAPFYRTAGIDATTATRFEGLVREHEASTRDLAEIARDLPAADRTEVVLAPDGSEQERIDPGIAEMRRRMAAQLEADQIALLGEERYRRLQEYQREEGKRRVVERLVGDLTLTDASMSPEQTRQLTAVLAAVDLAGKTNPDEKQWPEILARASHVLAAPQLAALKKQADSAESSAAMNAYSKLRRELGEQAQPTRR